jgi:Protein of unknown function (DUF4238)
MMPKIAFRMAHKKQHYIPRSYLEAWCDPNTPEGQEPYLWMFTRDGTDRRRKAPQNVFHETEFYTLKKIDGTRDLSLEHGLSELESQFATLRTNKLNGRLPLTTRERIVLCAFTAAMYARTKASGDRERPLWKELLDKMKKMDDWYRNATPEQLAKMASLPIAFDPGEKYAVSVEEVRQVVEAPVKHLLDAGISAATPLFMACDMAILETSTKPGFVTSDDPCVWADPQGFKRPFPYQGPALAYPSIEIHLPISPTQCLFLNRQQKRGYIHLADHGPLADAKVVAEANRRTIHYASEYFVSNSDMLLWSWFA